MKILQNEFRDYFILYFANKKVSTEFRHLIKEGSHLRREVIVQPFYLNHYNSKAYNNIFSFSFFLFFEDAVFILKEQQYI